METYCILCTVGFELYIYLYQDRIILSVYCELLLSLSANKCTYHTNMYFTLSCSYMFPLFAILKLFGCELPEDGDQLKHAAAR